MVNKITVGFVIQEFDEKSGKCVSQEFVAGDDVTYEDEQGKVIEWSEEEEDSQPFHMEQPRKG